MLPVLTVKIRLQWLLLLCQCC